MDKLRNPGLAMIVLILLGLGIIFRSFLFKNIVVPIAVLFWTLWRLLLSASQNTYWFILIILCLLLMLRFVRLPGKPAPRLAYGYKLDPVNRVDRWRVMIEASFRNENEDTKLRDSLREIVISTLATTHQMDLHTTEERILAEQYDLPPAIRQYLFLARDTQELPGTDKLLPRLRIPGFLKRKHALDAGARVPIEEVIQWAEKLMEIDHD